jgi:hypothetical protein
MLREEPWYHALELEEDARDHNCPSQSSVIGLGVISCKDRPDADHHVRGTALPRSTEYII